MLRQSSKVRLSRAVRSGVTDLAMLDRTGTSLHKPQTETAQPPPRTRSSMLAPFRVRSFRFQWPADLLASWAFEMETIILGWYVLVETKSVVLLTLFGASQYLC